MNIGVSIRNLRMQNNLSQNDLAEALHVTRQVVSNWETGKNEPDLETLIMMSKIFVVEISAILGTENTREEKQPLLFRKQMSKSSIIELCILGVPVFLTLFNGLFLLPKMAAEAQKTFRVLPYWIDAYVVIPIGCIFIGLLIAHFNCLGSFWTRSFLPS